MSPGQSRFDTKIPDPKTFSFLDRLRARNRFARRRKNIRAGFFTQVRQGRLVIRVRVRKENELHIQLVVVREAEHFAAIGASIKSCGRATSQVPDEIRVDGHIVIVRGELRDTVWFVNFCGTPLAPGEFIKRSRSETENR